MSGLKIFSAHSFESIDYCRTMTEKENNLHPSDNNRERRKFYRVNDAIGLEYKLIDQAPKPGADADSPFSVSGRFRLLNELNRIEQESSILLRHVSDEDRNLARYLSSQNKKIDIIARLIVSDEVSTVPYTVRNVSLSEGGCSFINEEPLEPNQYIALKLFFFSSYLGMVLYGQVVDNHPLEDETDKDAGIYQTNVEFVDLSGSDRQTLARYIIRRQAEQRRSEDDWYKHIVLEGVSVTAVPRRYLRTNVLQLSHHTLLVILVHIPFHIFALDSLPSAPISLITTSFRIPRHV